MESMVHRLSRAPATWLQLLEAAGATSAVRRALASKFLRQLVRDGLVIEPTKAGQLYRLAPLDKP